VCPEIGWPRDFVFEENRGQAQSQVQFIGRGGATVAFSKDGVSFGSTTSPVTLRFAGQSIRSRWESVDALDSTSSYFVGNNPAAWIRDIPHSSGLVRRGLYPGIDVVFHGNDGRLEYDFIVEPHAKPQRIRIEFTGARPPRINAHGDLIVETYSGTLICRRPRIFQRRDGERISIAGNFVADKAKRQVHFKIGPYDRDLPLTIDPTLDVIKFLGGTGNDRITAVLGSLVAGVTDSDNLSIYGPRHGGTDVFVWDGQNYLLYGGSGDEEPTAIAFAGNTPILVGWTSSRDFPVLAPPGRSWQRVFGGGNTDGFIIVGLGIASTSSISYLGGSGDDRILAVAGDP